MYDPALDDKSAYYETPYLQETVRDEFQEEPTNTGIPEAVINYLQIMYEDALCERCRDAGKSYIEDRAHILVECPCNREEVAKLQRRILRSINKHLHNPISTFPNWFAAMDSVECENTTKGRITISRWPKLAGMLGWIPVAVTNWFAKLDYKPKWNSKKMLAKVNKMIAQHGRKIFGARNKHWKKIQQHVFPDLKWTNGKLKTNGNKHKGCV